MSRTRNVNDAPFREDRSFVLYWMTSYRRTRFNFALDHAIGLARELGKPLFVLEALRVGYPFASDRLHRFVLDGMAANAKRFDAAGVGSLSFLEREPGEGKGLLAALSREAAVVVTDDWPSFFVPKMVAAAGEKLDVRLVSVDGNGLFPLRATDQIFKTAYSFRRYVQKHLRKALRDFPAADPLKGLDLPAPPSLPDEIAKRWPGGVDVDPSDLPIDHEVATVDLEGGEPAGRAVLRRFVDSRLSAYAEDRNHPDEQATSGLSPYLHFGHVSPHEVFRAVTDAEDWSEERLSEKADGRRSGFYGLSESAEGFLDQIVTWREVGFHTAAKLEGYDEYDSLPGWAQQTLFDHENDDREHLYSLEEFEAAGTHDRVWNAAQTQLVTEGTIHNYLRMLWGKKILEWTESPREALRIMLHLNDRFALDGRDPNSVSGIFWCLGRYDRAWGPERPVFGKIRFMSSKNTVRKARIGEYLERYEAGGEIP
jgi:deoxyribodipyrimidine photo-lyase